MTVRNPIVLVDGALSELPSTDTLTGAISSHSSLLGLDSDDHPQYHNDVRGDLRYSQLNHTQQVSTLEQSGAVTNQVLGWDGVAWSPLTSANAVPVSFQAAVMSSTESSTSTTLANATQLALPMVANGVYRIECFVTFQSAATTTGANVGLTTPTNARNMVEIVVPVSSVAASTQLRMIFPTGAIANNAGNVTGTGVTAISSNHTVRISGIIRNAENAGNCQVVFATEVAGSAVTLQIGSELQLIRIA